MATRPGFDGARLDGVRARLARHWLGVGIVGLGYAGLPLAMAFAEAGFEVTGVDLSDERVQAVQEHRSYLVDVPEERYEGLDGRLTATTDYAAVGELDALTICVPTPLSKTRTPDIGYVVSAAESVAANTRPGQLVVLQSTTSPGTGMCSMPLHTKPQTVSQSGFWVRPSSVV